MHIFKLLKDTREIENFIKFELHHKLISIELKSSSVILASLTTALKKEMLIILRSIFRLAFVLYLRNKKVQL